MFVETLGGIVDYETGNRRREDVNGFLQGIGTIEVRVSEKGHR
jgi:hypothetical protein